MTTVLDVEVTLKLGKRNVPFLRYEKCRFLGLDFCRSGSLKCRKIRCAKEHRYGYEC